jgi:DNA polymerase-3 subunit epsilon
LGTDGGFAVIDFETTGFGYKADDRIVEIGLVVLNKNLNAISTWSTLLNPQRDPGPVGVHGIRREWLDDAPRFEDVYHDLGQLLEGNRLVAHNAAFDIGFLGSELERIGASSNLSLVNPICTLRLSKKFLPRMQRHRLSYLAFELGLETKPNHSALTDAATTAELFRYMNSHFDSQ